MKTNEPAGAVALFVLQNSKDNGNEVIQFCASANQRHHERGVMRLGRHDLLG
jgi:hypothetical protein